MKSRFINFYMDIAQRAANMSYAEKLKVGAILVKNDNIISWSFNGTPRDWDNVCEDKVYITNGEESSLADSYILNNWPFEDENGRYYLKTKSCVTHAEEAMLMKISSSTESSEGASLFCTHSCCINCAKLIYGAKISEFYYMNEYRSNDGIEFLKKCGINVIKFNGE